MENNKQAIIIGAGLVGSLWAVYLSKAGYKVTIYTYYKLYGGCRSIEGIVKNFTSSSYYFMFPFKNFLVKRYTNFYNDVVANRNMPDYIKKIEEFLVTN
jgi:phytoene dehydrogenase-like protein